MNDFICGLNEHRMFVVDQCNWRTDKSGLSVLRKRHVQKFVFLQLVVECTDSDVKVRYVVINETAPIHCSRIILQ